MSAPRSRTASVGARSAQPGISTSGNAPAARFSGQDAAQIHRKPPDKRLSGTYLPKGDSEAYGTRDSLPEAFPARLLDLRAESNRGTAKFVERQNLAYEVLNGFSKKKGNPNRANHGSGVCKFF